MDSILSSNEGEVVASFCTEEEEDTESALMPNNEGSLASFSGKGEDSLGGGRSARKVALVVGDMVGLGRLAGPSDASTILLTIKGVRLGRIRPGMENSMTDSGKGVRGTEAFPMGVFWGDAGGLMPLLSAIIESTVPLCLNRDKKAADGVDI